jgi:hypothetical protein
MIGEPWPKKRPKAANQLIRLGERPVDHGALPAGLSGGLARRVSYEKRHLKVLVHGRAGVVVFASGVNLEAAFETGEAAAIEIVFDPIPGIAAAKIKIAENHAAEMGQVSNAALPCSNRGIKRDGADDPDEVFHLDRKEKIKIDDPVRIDERVSEEDTVDTCRRADAWPHLVGHEERVENAAADNGNKVIA